MDHCYIYVPAYLNYINIINTHNGLHSVIAHYCKKCLLPTTIKFEFIYRGANLWFIVPTRPFPTRVHVQIINIMSVEFFREWNDCEL